MNKIILITLIVFVIIGILLLIKPNKKNKLTFNQVNEFNPENLIIDPYKDTMIFWMKDNTAYYTPDNLVRFVKYSYWVFFPVIDNKVNIEIYDSNLNKISFI